MLKNKLWLVLWIIFEIIAISLWKVYDNSFYLYNFSYIGTALAIGIYLFSKNNKYARHITQILIGSYMLIYLGLILRENMQLMGFWYYLFLGVFEAATIHYVVAKIVGPLIFGRGWCGYACWTAMLLDLLPYKTPENSRKKFGYIRYLVFVSTLIIVGVLFLMKIENLENIMYIAFIIGNIFYYIVGIILAIKFRDNRAFCKYVCPITVFLKPMSYFSLIKIKYTDEKCIKCLQCKKVCPMDVDMMNNSRNRNNSTECILCGACAKSCPTKALR